MKKGVVFVVPVLLFIFVAFFLVNPTTINAQEESYYTNSNGVELSKEEYDKLISLFPESYIDNMTPDKASAYANGDVVDQETKYYRTIYQGDRVVSETEISEEEYDRAPTITNQCDEETRGSDTGYFETSYKRLAANIMDMGSSYSFSVTLTWKIMPVTRSYDVIAFRTKRLSYYDVLGCQTYYVGNTPSFINYNENSAGYKGLSNGAGMSMNLKDDTNITSFIMILAADMQISNYSYSTAHVFTTYQHAQSSLTRAQSKSYTLQAGGLGNVVYYSDPTIWNKYDDMTGIELIIPVP